MQFRIGRHPIAINAIRKGFNEVIPLELLQMFTVEELQRFWCGEKELNIAEWRANTHTSHGVDAVSVEYLWQWLEQASDNERRSVTRSKLSLVSISNNFLLSFLSY